MEIVQVFLLSRGRESKDMDGRRLFCLKAKSTLMLYQSDEIKSTLPASQSFYCSTSILSVYGYNPFTYVFHWVCWFLCFVNVWEIRDGGGSWDGNMYKTFLCIIFINLLLEMYENLNMDQTLQFCYKLEYCLVKLFDIKNWILLSLSETIHLCGIKMWRFSSCWF